MANYAITNSVVGNNVEGTFKVNYSNYNSNYKYILRISIPQVSLLQRIPDYVSDSEFTLTSGTISHLLQDVMKTTNEINLGFAVETYSGDTLLSSGNEKVVKCYVTDANPIFTNFQVTEQNEYVESLTGSTIDNIVHVNNYSDIAATIFALTQKAIAQKGATMVKYRLVIGNSSCDIPYDEHIDESGYIEKASTGVYNVYAIDSRGNSTLVTKHATQIKDYFDISFNKQLCRIERDSNGVGSNVILTLNGDIWNNNFGIVTNSITSVEYRFKKTDSTTWIDGTTTITPTITNNEFSFVGQIASDNADTTWDLDASYDVEVTVNDELSSSTASFILNSSIPTLSLDKQGIGVMCAYDGNIGGKLQVDGMIIDGGKLLWVNPDDTVDFLPQSITLNSIEYNSILWLFKRKKDQDIIGCSVFTIKGIGGMAVTIDSDGVTLRRGFDFFDDDLYTFGNCNRPDMISNNALIPMYAIGFETNLFN